MTTMYTTAELSADSRYRRYRLDRGWSHHAFALFVMLNPSTADATKDDPTIRRCTRFAQGWGCGGITVVNLYGLRSTDPKILRTHPEPVGPDNDAAILAAANTASRIICAWGAGAPSRIRVAKVIQILSEFGHGAKLHCLGKTAGGHPRHPLYVPASQPLEPFP